MELCMVNPRDERGTVISLINQLITAAERYNKAEINGSDNEQEANLLHGSMVVYSILKIIENTTSYKLENKYGTIMELVRKHSDMNTEELEKALNIMVFRGVREHEDSAAKDYFPKDKLRVSQEILKEKFGVISASEAQNKVRDLLGKIFTKQALEIIEEYSFRGLYLDFFIPDLNLAIEFDGKQHFEFTPGFHDSEDDFIAQRRRDLLKNRLCAEARITLVRISYLDPVCELWLREKINQALLNSGRGIN